MTVPPEAITAAQAVMPDALRHLGRIAVEAAAPLIAAAERDRYPYPDGETVVLGPEIFAAKDGSVICWKGVNYTPQDDPS